MENVDTHIDIPSSEGISIFVAIMVFSACPKEGSFSLSFMSKGISLLFTETAEDFKHMEMDDGPYGVKSA